jgi:hypothetical protein
VPADMAEFWASLKAPGELCRDRAGPARPGSARCASPS